MSAVVAIIVAFIGAVGTNVGAIYASRAERQTRPTNGLQLSAKLDQAIEWQERHALQDTARFEQLNKRLTSAGVPELVDSSRGQSGPPSGGPHMRQGVDISKYQGDSTEPVSYTHLTLPTILLV